MAGYVSPFEGLAEGFDQGTRLGIAVVNARDAQQRRARADQEHAQDRQYLLEERQRKRTKEDEDREDAEGARLYDMANADYENVTKEGTALAQRYGGHDKVPEAEGAAWSQRFSQARAARQAALDRKYKRVREKFEQGSRDFFTGLEKGNIDLASVSDEDLARHWIAATKRDPRDFLRVGPDGKSAVGRGIEAITTGLEKKDNAAIVEGGKVVFAPEIRQGLGSDGPDGTEIKDKQLAGFVPSPSGREIIPVVDVSVVDPRNPDRGEGRYKAPLTVGRSADPQAKVKSISIDGVMDTVGRLGVLEEFANHPEFRAKLERGLSRIQPQYESYMEAVTRGGVSPGKFTRDKTNLGDKVVTRTYNEAGQQVREQTDVKGTSPDAKERTRATGIRANGTQILPGEVDEEDPETGETTTREVAVRVPRAGATGIVNVPGQPDVRVRAPGARPKTEKEPKPREVEQAADNEVAREAARMNLAWDSQNKRWKQADGKPATQDQQTRLNSVRAAALDRGANAKGAADSVPKAKMSDTEVAAERDKANKALKSVKGKPELEKQIKDLFKERTGLSF